VEYGERVSVNIFCVVINQAGLYNDMWNVHCNGVMEQSLLGYIPKMWGDFI
jgi:hypothetical protein